MTRTKSSEAANARVEATRLEQAADVRCTVGELLTAMAHGEDALDERTGRSLQRAGRVIGPPGSQTG